LIVGNVYKMKARSTCNNAAATMFLSVSVDATLSPSVIFTQGTSTALIDNLFTATATTMYFGVVVSGHAANDTVTIDAGITVKEITNYTEANAASEIEYSQENVFGAEEVVNGDFATDSDWNKGTGWTISGGKASSQNTTSSDFLTTNVKIGMIQGKSYEFTFNIVDYTSGSITFAVFDGASGNSPQFTNVGKSTWIYTAVRDNDQFAVRAASTFTGSIDNVSVKEITNAVEYKNIPQSARELYSLEDDTWVSSNELVVNGDFATDLSGWATIEWFWDNGAAKIDSDALYKSIKQDILTVGSYYEIELDVTEFITGALAVKCGAGTDVNISSVGHKKVTVQATDIKFELLNTQAVTQCSIDNVSIKEIIEVAS